MVADSTTSARTVLRNDVRHTLIAYATKVGWHPLCARASPEDIPRSMFDKKAIFENRITCKEGRSASPHFKGQHHVASRHFAADRPVIRELIDACARCADRRDAKGQMSFLTEDTVFHVFLDGRWAEPTYVLHGWDALAPVFENLTAYQATAHLNGQSTVRIDGDHATGESYCIAARWSQPITKSWQYVKKILKIVRADLTLFATRHLMADWLDNSTIAKRTRDRVLGHVTDVPSGYGRKGSINANQMAAISVLEPEIIQQMREILVAAKDRAERAELIALKPQSGKGKGSAQR